MALKKINDPESANSEPNGKGDFDSFTTQVRNIDIINGSFESLCQNLKNIFNCETTILYTYDPEKKVLITQRFQTQENNKFSVNISTDNLAGYVAATGKPLNIHNVHSKEELERYHKNLKFDDSLSIRLNVQTRSLMLIPLPHRNKLVGVMELINKNDGNPFPEADFIKAKAISLVIGMALIKINERKYLNSESSNQNADRDANLTELTRIINGVAHPDEIFSEIKQPLMDFFYASACLLYGIDRKINEVVSKADWNSFNREILLPISSSNIAGFVIANDRLLNIIDANDVNELKTHHQDLQFDAATYLNSDAKIKSLLTVPLRHADEIVGVLQLINNVKDRGFDEQDEIFALAISEPLALAFQKLKIHAREEPTKYSYLVNNGYLTAEELDQVIKKGDDTHTDVESLLVDDLYLRSLDVGKSLESFYNISCAGYDESLFLPVPETFKIDCNTLRNQFWVPLKNQESETVVLINDPSNENIIEEIRKVFLPENIHLRVGLKLDILKYIDNFYRLEEVSESTETNVLPGDNTLELTIAEEYKSTASEEQNTPSDSTGQFFDEIISIAIRQGVTDIHIEPGMDGKNILVRLRKEGACRVFEEIPANFQTEIINHIKELAHLNPSVNKLPQNGKFVWSLGPNRYELNVVIFPTIGDLEDAMIRVSQIGKAIPSFMSMTDMDFSDPNLDKIMSRIHTAKGMILVAGSEGTGKTTSLHALLNHLNTSDKKIVTAENPVDIVQNGLRQLQMNKENGLDYALALETFLLGNPDIIMIGEIDNDTTLKLCTQAAQQRLVFTSLKAKSTMDAIRKMREMNIDANQFADAILLVMAQKLVPSLCDHCKEDYHPSQEEYAMLEKFYGDKNFSELGFQYNDNLTLKKAVGCKQCIFTGYSGQIALHEVLERTPELNRLIAGNAPMEEIHNQAFKDGMITLNQDGIYKIMNGDCDFKKIQEAFLPGRF